MRKNETQAVKTRKLQPWEKEEKIRKGQRLVSALVLGALIIAGGFYYQDSFISKAPAWTMVLEGMFVTVVLLVCLVGLGLVLAVLRAVLASLLGGRDFLDELFNLKPGF